jgi:hypothetical protein
MTNSEIYNTIAESLQCDIDTNAISYEYASIINDIAYDKFITESELPENVESILDRYISEAAGDDEETTEEVTESAERLDSMLEMASMIKASHESNEISDIEYNTLLESVFENIDMYTESFAGAGGARGKYIELQAKALVGTLVPYFKSVKDYYKREIKGNRLESNVLAYSDQIAKIISKIKPPSINDLVSNAKLPESVVKKNRDACNALKKFSGISLNVDINEFNIDKLNSKLASAFKGKDDADEIFEIIDETLKEIKNDGDKLVEEFNDAAGDVKTNTKAKDAFKKMTGQTSSPFNPSQIKQKMHDDKLNKLKKRNAEKMANRK